MQDAVDAKCTDLDIAARVNENFYLQYLNHVISASIKKSQVNDFSALLNQLVRGEHSSLTSICYSGYEMQDHC